MTAVLFVCLGNICRSPMAEGVFRRRVAARGLADRFRVDSCGTGRWHVGESPDPRTLEVLRRHGIHLKRVARQLTRADGAHFDWLLGMDGNNVTETRRVVGERNSAKVHLALETTTGGWVPDPYYGESGGFDHVYELLDDALDKWIDRMLV